MRKTLLFSVFLALGGCVSVPSPPAKLVDVRGQVRTPSPISQPAYVSVRLYSVIQQQLRLVAQARYRVTALPLHFAFRLMPTQVVGDGLLVRSELAWSDDGAVQSRSWQSVVPGESMNIQLGQLPCYPKCTISVATK